MESTLSDTWSQRALRVNPEPVARPVNGRGVTPAKLVNPGLAAIALRPEEIARLQAQGCVVASGTPVPIAKNGADLAQLQNVRVQFMEVTPELAQRWLKNNFRNRPVSDDVVDCYARDAVNGQWVTTHQGVAFNDRDELIDGQHRLMAIVKAGASCVLMVSFGWPSQIAGKEMTTMDAVDRGRPRSVADQLKIQHGFANGAITAAICASLSSICCGIRTRRLSVGQTLEVFRVFESSVLFVIEHRSKAHGLKAVGVLAGFAFAHAVQPEVIGAMFKRLVQGGELPEGTAMRRLREFLVSDDAKLLSRSADRGLAELVLQAIFFELEGKLGAELYCSQEGVNHFRALQVERVERVAKMFKLPGKV